MKKLLLLLALIVGYGFLNAATLKVAYVDFEKVFESYYKTEEVNKKLKAKTDEWQKQLDARKKEISRLKDEYDKKESKMSDDEKKKERNKIMKKLQEFQELGQDLTGKLKRMQFEEYDKLKKEILKVIERIRKRGKYVVVLDRLSVLAGGVDLTDKVIKELNKGHEKRK